jgi:hypothetical protein
VDFQLLVKKNGGFPTFITKAQESKDERPTSNSQHQKGLSLRYSVGNFPFEQIINDLRLKSAG